MGQGNWDGDGNRIRGVGRVYWMTSLPVQLISLRGVKAECASPYIRSSVHRWIPKL